MCAGGPQAACTATRDQRGTGVGCRCIRVRYDAVKGGPDTSSIWRTHNIEAADDFEFRFDYLAHYPSRKVRCLCELIT